ncbi:hypothetical protein ACTXT7_004844 [Hymenolepis weldensis]
MDVYCRALRMFEAGDNIALEDKNDTQKAEPTASQVTQSVVNSKKDLKRDESPQKNFHGRAGSTTQETRLVRANRLLNKLKQREEKECLWFFSHENNFHQDEKVNRKNDGRLWADPTEFPTVMRERRTLESVQMQMPLQTIVVKQPWIDGVVNGGRPSMSSNRIQHHPLKLSTHWIGWMAENFRHHVTPNLWPPSNSPDLNPLD